MPYITPENRARLAAGGIASLPGELNYQITRLVLAYVDTKGLSYQTCNDVVGALDNAKHEFQRRLQDPYEADKRNLNGDVGYDEAWLSYLSTL